MSVRAIVDDYADRVPVLDTEANFHGNRVVYLHWEEHLSFCAALAFPLPPAMPWGALLEQIIPTYYGMHPDFKKIDWSQVKWTIDGKELTPDPAKSLEENGVRHKSLIRFWTPGLNGYNGANA